MNAIPVTECFRNCPRCAAPIDRRIGQNGILCSSCGFRYFINPGIAIGAILLDSEKNTLLIRRAKDPGKGKRCIVGGFAEPKETAEEALKREVFEEVGLHCKELKYIMSLPNIYPAHGLVSDVLDLFYCARVDSFEPITIDTTEVTDVHLCRPEEVDIASLAFHSVRVAFQTFMDDIYDSSGKSGM